MGSPHQACRISFTGGWVPELDLRWSWIPLQAYSNDGKILALAKWDILGNSPGFRIVVIDEGQRTVKQSKRISGCCESLAWEQGLISWKAFVEGQGNINPDFTRNI